MKKNYRFLVAGQLMALLISIMLLSASAHAQQRVVTGTVTDAADGSPLIGVSILVVGSQKGTITNIDGKYTLSVAASDRQLQFSFIGYLSQTVDIGNRSIIDISLEVDAEQLEEVVVVGYGVQKKSDLTGSVTSIKSEEITKLPVPNATESLQGRVSGVQITQTSGTPGAEPTVRIRGVGTTGDASPLFVVDGMLLDDISFIAPTDIASMEVLKDASATAIYGSRVANGVIIVTTKQGKDGRPTITFDGFFGFQNVYDRIDLVGARDYAILVNEIRANDGQPPTFTDEQIAGFGGGTDWFDEILQTAAIQNYQVGMNGGSENVKYNVGIGYFDQAGVVDGSDFQRFNLRLNNNYKITDHWSIGHNIGGVYTLTNEVPGDIVQNAYWSAPIVPVTQDGFFAPSNTNIANPVAQEFFFNRDVKEHRVVGNAFMDIKFFKNYFTFRTNYGVDISFKEIRQLDPQFAVSPLQLNRETRFTREDQDTRSWLWENTLNFFKEWGSNHRLGALVGYTSQEFRFENVGGSVVGFPTDFPGEAVVAPLDNTISEDLWYINGGLNTTDARNSFNIAEEWSIASFLFRANYTLMEKYLLTVSVRNDGSSRFGRNERHATFPSVALGWRMKQEGFMEGVDVISNLKLRGSWGQIGNDKIGIYASQSVATTNRNYLFGDDVTFSGITVNQTSNPDLKWETTAQFNIGFELGMWQDRLGLEFDYYQRDTDDLLVDVEIPSQLGLEGRLPTNLGEVRNKGVDISLNWEDRPSDKFSYSFGVVLSTVDNEVRELGGGGEILDGVVGGNINATTTRTVVGEPIGSFFGFKTQGVFVDQSQVDEFNAADGDPSTVYDPQAGPGDLIMVDTNGDGTITDDDRVFLGSPIPNVIYGINFGFEWSGVDFSMSWTGQGGNELYNAKKQIRVDDVNFEDSYLGRWQQPGDVTNEPRVTNGGGNYRVSDRFVEYGGFFRLRSLQVGYSFKQGVLDALHLKSLRAYVSGTNIWTFADYSGFTPEIGGTSPINTGIDRGVYPIPATYQFGLNISF